MKTNLSLALLLCSLSSCVVNRYVAPPFTNLEMIMQLEPGQSVKEVSDKLRIPPYDIAHSHENGSMILIYNYRVKDRNMTVPARAARQMIHGEEGQRDGELWYNMAHRELFLLFKNDTLHSIYGEKVFSEGSYLEAFDKRLGGTGMARDTNYYASDSDALFLQNTYLRRYDSKKEGTLEEDETVKKRRQILSYVGIGAAVLVVGLISRR